MEILINELSLKGQYNSVDEFVSIALNPLISLLQEFDSSRDEILKKYDLYSRFVTPNDTLHDVFKGSYSRTCDEIRRVKSKLSALLDNPYWQDSQKHASVDSYIFNGSVITDSSLAESCERDKVVISFICDGYGYTKLDVEKNTTTITVDNLFTKGHYCGLVRARGIIIDFALTDSSRFKKTSLIRQGQAVYKELSTKCYWYLDNLHKDHYEIFDSNEEHLGIADLNGNVNSAKRVDGRKL